jgi:hypothetical protein
MAGLGGDSLLAFPLGGEGVAFSNKPLIVNLNPPAGAVDASLLAPVQFSVRDVETAADLRTLHTTIGYASVFSHGEDYFDFLPRTSRGSILGGPFYGEPLFTKTSGGVRITKTNDHPQKSVYFTALDVAGILYPSGLLSVELQPEIENASPPDGGPLISSIFPGIMPAPWINVRPHVISGTLGLEIGPRNTGLYLFLVNTGTFASPVPQIRVTGPEVDGVCSPDYFVPYNWYGTHRFYLLWNEGTKEAEIFADVNGYTKRIFTTPFFDEFGTFSFNTFMPGSSNYQRHGGDLDIVGVYGQEGRLGSRMTIQGVALTADVGYPIIGTSLLDSFVTTRRSAELVRLYGSVDPRLALLSPWFDTPKFLIPNPDPDATKKVVSGAFRITKNAPGMSSTLYRDEPGLLRSVPSSEDPPAYTPDGFMLEATFFANCSQLIEAATGMGFFVFDGATVYELALFDDSRTRTLGLLQKGGDPLNINHRFLPDTPINWASPATFRFVVDPRRGKLEMFGAGEYATPVMSLDFDRTALPSGKEYGVLGRQPFIAFGHTLAAGTMGSFDLYDLKYCHVLQAWESRTENNPGSATPAFTLDHAQKTSQTTAIVPGDPLTISCGPNQTARYWRQASFDTTRGVILEAQCKVTAYKNKCRTGVYLAIVDGVYSYLLTFVDTSVGKFVCLSQHHNLNSFWEYPGFEGVGKQSSFLLDWTDTDYFGFPAVMPDLPITSPCVGFGHFSGEGGASSWRYVRTMCSTGFEISTHKNLPPDQIVEELFGTEAIVVAHVLDED